MYIIGQYMTTLRQIEFQTIIKRIATCTINGVPIDANVAHKLATDLEYGCCKLAITKSKERGVMPILAEQSNDPCTIAYTSACSRILSMLRKKPCVLLEKIIDGTLNAKIIAQLPLNTIYPDILRKERDIYAARTSQKIAINESILYKCSKCGVSRTSYYEVQTRGSDEPPTMKLTCQNCGHKWSRTG